MRFTERDEFGHADIIGVDSADLQLNLEFDEFNKVTDALDKLAAYEDIHPDPKMLTVKTAITFEEDGKIGMGAHMDAAAMRKLHEYEEIDEDPKMLADIVASQGQIEEIGFQKGVEMERKMLLDRVLKIINEEKSCVGTNQASFDDGMLHALDSVEREIQKLRDDEGGNDEHQNSNDS